MNRLRSVLLVFFAVFAILGLIGLSGQLPPQLFSLLLLICAGMGAALLWRNTLSVAAEPSAKAPLLENLSWEEREAAALDLRATREREQAFYDLTVTLSKSLDSQKILMAAQSMGDMIVKRKDDHKVVSAAMLFREDTRLHISSQRGLTLKDQEMILPGQQGILGIALKQENPVFGGLASRDPELTYMVGFRDSRSLLAIPLRAGFECYGVLVFGSTQENAFSEELIEMVKAIGTQTTITLQNATLYQNVAEEKERIVQVDEEARKKLSRDLHDGPTQDIAAITMHLNFVRRLIEQNKTQEAVGMIAKIEDLARTTTKQIRHMLFTLRPLILETQGLAAALGQLAEKMRETFQQNVLVEVQKDAEHKLDYNDQGTVFYIVEEALSNARKHAQAKHIWVRLYERDHLVVLEIEDDGVGFDQNAVEAGTKRNSLGMTNLRDRADLAKGTLHIQSQVGRGTKITVLIPIKEQAAGVITATPKAAEAPTKPAPKMTQQEMPVMPAPAQQPSASTSQLRRISNTTTEAMKAAPIPFADKRSPMD
jgi:signal transduction histidine kinase